MINSSEATCGCVCKAGNSVENNPQYICTPCSVCSWSYGSNFDVVTELTKRRRQTLAAVFPKLGIGFVALLEESNSLMQDLPNDAAESMGNCPNCGLVAESRE
jgi:hypothetical protein